MSLGEKLKKYRKQKGFTLAALALKSEINLNTISRIETGKRQPHPSTIEKIATALNISTDKFYK